MVLKPTNRKPLQSYCFAMIYSCTKKSNADTFLSKVVFCGFLEDDFVLLIGVFEGSRCDLLIFEE